MPKNWHVDEGLAVLIGQWKAKHPGAVVYTIADNAHSTDPDVSQHAPEPSGEVDAADFMPGKGSVTMADLRELRDNLREERDPRLLYLIIDKQIVSSRPVGGYPAWAIRPYGGKLHTHLHVSVNDLFARNTNPWDIDGKDDDVAREYTMRQIEGLMPELRLGDEDEDGKTAYIWRAQRLLGVGADGVYGRVTSTALAKRMAAQSAYKPSSSNGTKLYEPEWRVLFGLWGK